MSSSTSGKWQPIRAVGRTDVGRVRTLNEDYFYVSHDRQLFVVADGMGGHAAGEIASSMAVETISDFATQNANGSDTSNRLSGQEFLVESIQTANSRIFHKANELEHTRGMGTTIVGVKVEDNVAHIAHVGDSRAYLFRDGKISILTSDHSWVQFQVMLGNLTHEQARYHPLKNIITKALGIQEEVEIDINSLRLRRNDRILLCSDGLNGLVRDEDIKRIVADSGKDISEAADALIKEALGNGGDDNVTVILIEWLGEEPSVEKDTGEIEVDPASSVDETTERIADIHQFILQEEARRKKTDAGEKPEVPPPPDEPPEESPDEPPVTDPTLLE